MIAYGTDRIWPPRSPDLNPLDFWFWGPCEAYVYEKQPQDFEELKAVVAEYAASIPEDVVRRVLQNMRKRARACIDAEGKVFLIKYMYDWSYNTYQSYWTTRPKITGTYNIYNHIRRNGVFWLIWIKHIF